MGLRTKLRKFFYKQKFKQKNLSLNLSGQKILITGGNSGIGLALTKKLLELNNEVFVTHKENKENLISIKDKNIHLINCDLRKEELFEWLEKVF